MATILEAKKITKKFLHPQELIILNAIDFTLEEGKTCAIVGKSGEGKSTLLHILGTIDTPTTGDVSLFGMDAKKHNREKLRNQHLGFIFQAFHLLADATAIENVLMPARIGRNSIAKNSKHYNRARSLLEQVGLSERMYYHTDKLSGGEKQRVCLARALINDPEIIFADEPTGNLDHITAELVINTLFSLVRKNNKAMVLVTHSYELAKQCDQIVYLENGRLSLLEGQ